MKVILKLVVLTVLCSLLCSCAHLGNPARYGTRVKLQAPADADVYVDGKCIGHTVNSTMYVILVPGDHTIKAKSPGFQWWEQTVNIRRKGTTSVPGADKEGWFEQLVWMDIQKL